MFTSRKRFWTSTFAKAKIYIKNDDIIENVEKVISRYKSKSIVN